MDAIRRRGFVALLALLLGAPWAGCGSECPAACPAGEICVAGSCVSACNPPCGPTEHCNATTRLCEAGAADADADAAADADAEARVEVDTEADDGPGADGDGPDDAPVDAGPPLVDLVILLENTGSFHGDRAHLPESVQGLLDAFLASSSLDWDLMVGVAHLGDFPVGPYGEEGTDVIFGVVRPVTSDLAGVGALVGEVPYLRGGDLPDGAVPALGLLATNAGLPPFFAPLPCPAGGEGAVCLRPGSQRVVILFTNSPMHVGPPDGTLHPYGAPDGPEITPDAGAVSRYPQTVAALVAGGIRVIGISTGYSGSSEEVHDQLVPLASDTATWSAPGEPAVYDLDFEAGPQDLAFLLDVIDGLVR